MSKRFLSVFSILLAAIMLISGCAAQASAAPERSKAVNFVYGERPDSLDPTRRGDNPANQVAFNMYYETLIATDHTGGEYQPMLATSWEIDPQGYFWTFHLREGVKFHNGEPLTPTTLYAHMNI